MTKSRSSRFHEGGAITSNFNFQEKQQFLVTWLEDGGEWTRKVFNVIQWYEASNYWDDTC